LGGTTGLYRSDDYCITWDEVIVGHNVEGFTDVEQMGGTLFAGSISVMSWNYPGGLFRSIDQGVTWTRISDTSYFYGVFGIEILNEDEVLYLGTKINSPNPNVGLFKSMDQGYTWSTLLEPSYGYTSLLVDQANGIFVGGQQKLLYSSDEGMTWVDRYEGLPEYSDIETLYSSPDGYIYCITYSPDGFFRSVNPIVAVEEIAKQNPPEINIFPNPADDRISIHITSPESLNIEISLYSYTGGYNELIWSGNINKARKQIVLNTEHYPQGVYIISVHTNSEVITKKVLISH
jgi:hypothetical protein